MAVPKKWLDKESIPYENFNQLDGSHPWQQAVPKGFVLYEARELKRGKVTYFNYALAKEMGLIPSDHPEKMNVALEQKLISTFTIQIVNEFDIENRPHIKRQAMPERKFMATRYLQLQHPTKNGKTSGDGRCIWNGVVRHNNKVWDVSSRGTGVTCLAPGVVLAGKPLKTGQDEVGYGCGMAELDELYAAAIMSEVFHRQGIPTERVLCIIDIGRGFGIGVRAAQNLVRPAHLFLFLKQNDHVSLKSATEYLIQRQCRNREWKFHPKDPQRFDKMLAELEKSFARFAANLDADYIFAWLDWDGDNVLANAGIIDYGSIRQFGMRHDQYRYDDVDRYSTNLNEQRQKARMILQVFVQLVDFVKTQRRRSVKRFENHPILKKFDRDFEKFRYERVLYRTGLSREEIEYVMKAKPGLVARFDKAYRKIEGFKTKKKIHKVADGINRPAIFNIRRLIRTMPELYLENKTRIWIPEIELFMVALGEGAKGRDRHMTSRHEMALEAFQQIYRELIMTVRGRRDFFRVLKETLQRAQKINREDRMTGNSVTMVVEEIMAFRKGLGDNHAIQESIDHFIASQILLPSSNTMTPDEIINQAKTKTKPLLKTIFEIVQDASEDI